MTVINTNVAASITANSMKTNARAMETSHGATINRKENQLCQR